MMQSCAFDRFFFFGGSSAREIERRGCVPSAEANLGDLVRNTGEQSRSPIVVRLRWRSRRRDAALEPSHPQRGIVGRLVVVPSLFRPVLLLPTGFIRYRL